MNQFPFNNLTRSSRACAFFLDSLELRNDIEIIQLILFIRPYTSRKRFTQDKCVVLNRRLPVSVVPLPVNLVSERRSAIR